MREDIEDQEVCMEKKTMVFSGKRELSHVLKVCPPQSSTFISAVQCSRKTDSVALSGLKLACFD